MVYAWIYKGKTIITMSYKSTQGCIEGYNSQMAHSVRGASSSKGKVLGATITEILRKGNCKNESTWQKHYHKLLREVFQTV